MSIEMWLFVFAFIQTVCSVFAGLQFFGITPSNLAMPMKSKAWLVIMLFLWLGALGFTGYGIYQLRERSSEIVSLKDEGEQLKNEITKLKANPPKEQPSKEAPDLTKPLVSTQEVVYKKTFMNEVVEMDGKTFNECRFVNVTLDFKGIAPTTFVKSHFSGVTQVVTNNWAVKSYNGLLEEFKKNPQITNIIVGEKDESGAMRVLSNTVLNRPPKKLPDKKK